MKKQTFVILLLLLNSIIAFIPVNIVRGDPNPSGGNIVGDTVYWENSYANLSVYPHTSTNIVRQKQWANLTWKASDNVIDVAFRFNDSLSYGKIWRWDGDSWISVSMSHTEYGGKHYYYYARFNVVQNTTYRFKWEYNTIANTSGKWDLFAKLNEHTVQQAIDNNWYVALDPWWNSSWSYYRTLTINPTYIDADLSNFSVLVNVSATISAKCDSGNSIRFLNTDNTTEYYYEIEDTWNAASYNFVWVNITSISSSADTRFLMYYGNSGASDNQSSVNVWDSGYKLVSHLNTSDSTTVIVDSTSNRNNGSKLANAEPSQATGNIGYGQNYDGDDDNISYSNIGDFFWGFEVWIKPAAKINSQSSATQFINVNSSKTLLYALFGSSTGLLEGETFCFHKATGGETRVGITASITASWHLLSMSWDDNEFQIYLDGVNLTEVTSGVTSQQTMTNLILGNFSASVSVQDMDVDEFRVSIVKRNDSWMKAVFHSGGQTSGFLTFGLERMEENITTNATTGIGLTNATARGFFSGSGFSGNYNYGFWIGQTTPITEANVDQNVTGVGTITAPNNFSYNVLSLNEGTHYYDRAWVSNATSFETGNEVEFYTKCNVPTGFTATLSGCNVALAWTKGTGADRTTIVRKVDAYPESVTDGTVVYNNTASSYSDTTGGGSHQYYRAWSWAGDKHSDSNASANVAVPPCPPTSVSGAVLVNNTLNITWTVGTGAVTTVVVRKVDSSPATVTDGTVMYNSTGTHFVATDLTGNYYYGLWSYANETYSSSVAFDFGALVINCYDEETNNSLYFDAFVSNQSGTQTYESKNNTNPLIINVGDNLPIDDKVSIRVDAASNYSEKTETFTGYDTEKNATVTYIILLQEPESKALTNVTCRNTSSSTNSYPPFTLAADVITILAADADEFTQITVNYTHYEYSPRTYYRDLTTNHVFILNAYLPSADDKILCRIIVIDEFDQVVDDAYVEIKRNIDGNWVTIASRYTDGNGQVDVFLVDGVLYKFVISKTGYVTEYADWTPDPVFYGANYPKIFRILRTATEEETYTFWNLIRFNATLHTNGSLFVNYVDYDTNTTDAQFYIYENYNFSITYITTDSTTSNTFSFWATGLNNSRTHEITIYLNHTTLGFEIKSIIVLPVDDAKYTEDEIERKISNAIGPFSLGYVQTFLVYLPIVFFLVLPGPKHPGFAIIMASVYAGFASSFIVVGSILMIIPFAVAIGIILMAVKGGMLKL